MNEFFSEATIKKVTCINEDKQNRADSLELVWGLKARTEGRPSVPGAENKRGLSCGYTRAAVAAAPQWIARRRL